VGNFGLPPWFPIIAVVRFEPEGRFEVRLRTNQIMQNWQHEEVRRPATGNMRENSTSVTGNMRVLGNRQHEDAIFREA